MVRLILNFTYSQQENRAIGQFNSGEPWKAIESLGFEDKPEDAADFLHRTPSLDTMILGEMLSEPKREKFMRVYVQRLNLSNLALDGALRRLLQGFRLPGEAQKIDRIMDAFAEHWLSCQADGGTAGPLTTDTAFLMSFALIMLNTDLHNPSVKRKMSLKQFQSNLRGVNAGQDLPKAFIKKLYNNVKREAFCLNSRFTGNGTCRT
jgi:Sec7-like guanine-nucleotide exchange factor